MELNLSRVNNIEKYMTNLTQFPVHLLAECNRKILKNNYKYLKREYFEKIYWLIKQNYLNLFDDIQEPISSNYMNDPLIITIENNSNEKEILNVTNNCLYENNSSAVTNCVPFFAVIENIIIKFDGKYLELINVLNNVRIFGGYVDYCEFLANSPYFVINYTKNISKHFYFFIEKIINVCEGTIVHLNDSFFIEKKNNNFCLSEFKNPNIKIGIDADFIYPNINKHNVIFLQKNEINTLLVYKEGNIVNYFSLENNGQIDNLKIDMVDDQNIYFTYRQNNVMYGLKVSENYSFSIRLLEENSFSGFTQCNFMEYLHSRSNNYKYVINIDTDLKPLHQYSSFFLAGTNKFVDFLNPQIGSSDIIVKNEDRVYLLPSRLCTMLDEYKCEINEKIVSVITMKIGSTLNSITIKYIVLTEYSIYQSNYVQVMNFAELDKYNEPLEYIKTFEISEPIIFKKIADNKIMHDKIMVYINYIK